MMDIALEDIEKIPAEDVFLLQGSTEGKAYWRYLRIEKRKKPLFEAALRNGGDIRPNDFGSVLYAGEGDEPPMAIQNLIKLHTGQTA